MNLVSDFANLQPWFRVGLSVVPAGIVLIWFARRASSISFMHSLSMIGLAAAMASPGTFIPPHVIFGFLSSPPAALFIVLAVGKLFARMLGLWSLVQDDTGVTSPMDQAIRAVAMVAISIAMWGVVDQWWEGDFVVHIQLARSGVVPSVTFLLFVYGAIALISYLVRVRQPQSLQPRKSFPSTSLQP